MSAGRIPRLTTSKAERISFHLNLQRITRIFWIWLGSENRLFLSFCLDSLMLTFDPVRCQPYMANTSRLCSKE